MHAQRIIGAFTFRSGVYEEVEEDPAFTQTAWLLVLVSGFLNQLGTRAGGGPLRWLFGTLAGTVAVVVGFALGAFLVAWVGRLLFQADVTLFYTEQPEPPASPTRLAVLHWLEWLWEPALPVARCGGVW